MESAAVIAAVLLVPIRMVILRFPAIIREQAAEIGGSAEGKKPPARLQETLLHER
jgi:hypothetical protein